MKEILLSKAKRISDGKWLEGFYVEQYDCHLLYLPEGIDSEHGFDNYHVKPETVCRYTGKTDKNERKIWEHDFVFVTDSDGCSGQVDTGLGEVLFLDGLWYIDGCVQNSLYDIDRCFQIEVVGNVFDNPELLGEARQVDKLVP